MTKDDIQHACTLMHAAALQHYYQIVYFNI